MIQPLCQTSHGPDYGPDVSSSERYFVMVKTDGPNYLSTIEVQSEAVAKKRADMRHSLASCVEEMLSMIGNKKQYRKLASHDRFVHLCSKWKTETKTCSTIRDAAMHPSYQEIIGMGPDVLPLLFEELASEPNHWFWALRAITGVDPVRPANRGDILGMRSDWLHWAHENGYYTDE